MEAYLIPADQDNPCSQVTDRSDETRCLLHFRVQKHAIETHISVIYLKKKSMFCSLYGEGPWTRLLFHNQMSAAEWHAGLEERARAQNPLLHGYLMAYGTWCGLCCESLTSQSAMPAWSITSENVQVLISGLVLHYALISGSKEAHSSFCLNI